MCSRCMCQILVVFSFFVATEASPITTLSITLYKFVVRSPFRTVMEPLVAFRTPSVPENLYLWLSRLPMREDFSSGLERVSRPWVFTTFRQISSCGCCLFQLFYMQHHYPSGVCLLKKAHMCWTTLEEEIQKPLQNLNQRTTRKKKYPQLSTGLGWLSTDWDQLSLLGLQLITCRQLCANCRQTEMWAVDRLACPQTEISSISISSRSTACRPYRFAVDNHLLLSTVWVFACMYTLLASEYSRISSILSRSLLQWMWGTQNTNTSLMRYFSSWSLSRFVSQLG